MWKTRLLALVMKVVKVTNTQDTFMKEVPNVELMEQTSLPPTDMLAPPSSTCTLPTLASLWYNGRHGS